MAGVLGIDPMRLFSFTFREFINYSKGVKKRESKEENHFRRIAWILAKAHEDPKNRLPNYSQFWSIPYLDEEMKPDDYMTPEEAEELKQKLIKAWQINN